MTMRIGLAITGTLLVLLSSTAAVETHHAFSAEFDANRPLQLRGVLVRWEMINPHSWFHLDIKGPDGKVETWMIEGGSPNQLIRLGVTKHSLQVGSEILVDGYQAKDRSMKAVGRNFTLADGRRLFLGGSAPGATPTVK
jgi:hypothetical protein